MAPLLLWALLGPACLSLSLLGGPALALPKGLKVSGDWKKASKESMPIIACPTTYCSIVPVPLSLPPGASSHSLRYFCTGLTESSPGLPHFIAEGYVDEQPFFQYDSQTLKAMPRVPWMEKADSEYWVQQTQIFQNTEAVFRADLAIAQQRYNQSGGAHTWQLMYGCDLRRDGSKGGYYQYAYDGVDFISLDTKTLTWTAPDGPAQITKSRWERETHEVQRINNYLEEICIKWLNRYLDYGEETLLRTERPVGKVSLKSTSDGQEALICQAHGFYPREIDATWTKGEQNMDHETFRRNIARNFDGTYHTWLSIDIDPKERDLYRCNLDHASLPKPLVLAYEEPDVNMGIIVGAIVGIVVILMIAVGIYFIVKKIQEKPAYEVTSTSDKSSDSSVRARGLLDQ